METEKKTTRRRSSKIDELDPATVQESMGRQVATLALSGISVRTIGEKLKITPAAVRRIMETDHYKGLIADSAEQELGPALAKAKSQLAKLAPKAVKAIERALDEGSARDALQAATIVLKSVGLHEEKDAQQDQSITIVMPNGIEAPITYEVPKDE